MKYGDTADLLFGTAKYYLVAMYARSRPDRRQHFARKYAFVIVQSNVIITAFTELSFADVHGNVPDGIAVFCELR